MNSRILLIDPDPGRREGIKQPLEAAGYELVEVADPARALETFEFVQPDLVVVCDLSPDGLASRIFSQLKETEHGARTPFVCVGREQPDPGFAEQIAPPVSGTDLADLCGRLLAPSPEEMRLSPNGEESSASPPFVTSSELQSTLDQLESLVVDTPAMAGATAAPQAQGGGAANQDPRASTGPATGSNLPATAPPPLPSSQADQLAGNGPLDSGQDIETRLDDLFAGREPVAETIALSSESMTEEIVEQPAPVLPDVDSGEIAGYVELEQTQFIDLEEPKPELPPESPTASALPDVPSDVTATGDSTARRSRSAALLWIVAAVVLLAAGASFLYFSARTNPAPAAAERPVLAERKPPQERTAPLEAVSAFPTPEPTLDPAPERSAALAPTQEAELVTAATPQPEPPSVEGRIAPPPRPSVVSSRSAEEIDPSVDPAVEVGRQERSQPAAAAEPVARLSAPSPPEVESTPLAPRPEPSAVAVESADEPTSELVDRVGELPAPTVEVVDASFPVTDNPGVELVTTPSEALTPASVGPPVDLPAEIVRRFEPTFPERLQAKHRGVSVVLEVSINETGRITKVIVDEGIPEAPELETAAIYAVLRWKYRPAIQDGIPVASQSVVRFDIEP